MVRTIKSKGILSGMLLGLAFLLLPAGQIVAALTCPTVGSNTSGSTSSTEGSSAQQPSSECGSTASNLKIYLKEQGYSDNAICGIMGNIKNESGFVLGRIQGKSPSEAVGEDFRAYTNGVRNPDLIRNGSNLGFGLAQWTSSGRLKNLQNYADSIGKGIATFDAQGPFLVNELTNSYNMGTSRMNSMSLEEATFVVYRNFEIPKSSFCVGEKCCSQSQISNGKCNGTNTNQERPPTNYSSFIANKSKYQMAYKAFQGRVRSAEYVRDSVPTTNCTQTGGSEEGGSGEGSGGEGDDGEGGGGQVTGGEGALGKQSTNGMVGQFDSGIKNVVWRTDGSTIGSSGCSLISVVNANNALGRSSLTPSTLAGWSKSNIGSANWDNLKKMARYIGLSTSDWLWSSKSTAESVKIQKIRDTLASGGVIIAGGDRSGTDSSFCTSSRINSGECVFSSGGHFVTIIGITADNKLVIANPAKANNRTWIFPASTVLKYSNKAIKVK